MFTIGDFALLYMFVFYRGRTWTARAKHKTFATCLRNEFVRRVAISTFVKINSFLPWVRDTEVLR